MAYYKSLREYVTTLDKMGEMVTVKSPVNKDTELAPFVYLQWRGLPLKQQKAFLFNNVTDSRGKKYDIPVAYDTVGRFAALSLQCQTGEVSERVAQAIMHPIAPSIVKEGPVQEIVRMGDRLLEKGGMDEFPVPIAHPGWDCGPIMGSSCWITKDPDTGVRNVGLYRSDLLAQDRLGIHVGGVNDGIMTHWQKCRARGKPLQAAIVIGGPPNLTYVGAMHFPFTVDEYSISGGLVGEPVELVKCKTIDLEVPANADIVFEGELTTEELVLEGPHGESYGLASMGDMQPYLRLKCITRRKDAIWPGPPYNYTDSLQSGLLYKRLRYDLKLSCVLAVAGPLTRAPSVVGQGNAKMTVIKIKANTDQQDVWRALDGAATGQGNAIAVDEDIDIQDMDMVLWAMSVNALPHRDYKIVQYTDWHPLTSVYMPEPEMIATRSNQWHPAQKFPQASRCLINATRKWPYPPMNMPKKEFMEKALKIWQKEGLPSLELGNTWYGHEQGYWPAEYEEDAQRAVRGEYYKTHELRFEKRIKTDRFPIGDNPVNDERWPKD